MSCLLRFPVTVYFMPILEGEAVVNLKCDVKRKTQPLSLNIKATGYSMNVSVRCEDSDNRVIELSAQEINVIDFKEVSSSLNHSLHKALRAWALTRSFAGTFEPEGMFFFILGSLEGGSLIFCPGHWLNMQDAGAHQEGALAGPADTLHVLQALVLAAFSPQVQLNENIKRIFSIRNNGKFSFTFSWELSGPAALKQVLTITPRTGSVRAEGKAETQLAFHPQKMCSLKDVELTLQVRHRHLIPLPSLLSSLAAGAQRWG